MNDTASDWQANINRTTVRLGAWTAAWVGTMALATFGPKFLWNEHTLTTTLAIAFNLLIGFGMIYAHKNHLKSLDELHQKIQLEAMGITLGVALVVGLAYSNLDVANIIAHDAEISHLVLLLGFTYMGAMFLGMRRYR